uniref:NADH dehydrogenase subunit 6 n=2 Tax=Adelphocoris TaxID=236345 RepID=W8FRJ8_9HEMI|nr:NADH dehydrogenase subunit 6 [Adelphocoris fasciaticollis]AHK09967.1 NADH dehydrogenase subunit 6 [Adelphocoris fasciaticollis]AHL44278.1 NADH dehydrogenase subunit 6 [Adelphocoris suturalis]ANT45781.1 NADH dehydrogenase subunit 6 [Adelphocoris fasciaticollis]ANT45807.1 NADH dehydrogenase subunit 6 [Adelphocoris suturalis]
MMTITFMMLTINMMMIYMKHPLSMGMMLILQTMLMSMLTGLMNSFWMSYILLISMLSGALVLFIYMSSVASNEKFMNKKWMWMFAMTMLMMSLLFLFLEKKMIIKNNYFSMEMMNNDIYPLNKMFNMENMIMIMFLIMYLLLTMIVSTYMVNISEGPMRFKM